MNDSQFATAMDCEGYIGIYRAYNKRTDSYHFSARISLGMTDSIIPNEFVKRFGSRIYVHIPRSGHKTSYSWVVQENEQVKNVLITLLPHLLVKREQAKNVLDFIEFRSGKCNRGRKRTIEEKVVLESYWLKAKELNQRAPATTERENPVMGSYSLNPLETLGEKSEESSPLAA